MYTGRHKLYRCFLCSQGIHVSPASCLWVSRHMDLLVVAEGPLTTKVVFSDCLLFLDSLSFFFFSSAWLKEDSKEKETNKNCRLSRSGITPNVIKTNVCFFCAYPCFQTMESSKLHIVKLLVQTQFKE